MNKTAVILVNLGTPDSPKVADVRKYLAEFLSDPRVVDLPWLVRKILVNWIIVPFRGPKSAKAYEEVWTEEGSPLMIHSLALAEKVQAALGDEFDVELAMRYRKPSMVDILENVRRKNPARIIIVPLYPHYASSTSGSIAEQAMDIIKNWYVIPDVRIVGQFYDHPKFIQTIVERARVFDINSYDHILFSYHGLPIRQLDKVYDEGLCADKGCENEITEVNKYCYKATCYETTRLLVKALNLTEGQHTTAFQSRLAKDWLEPFADQEIEKLAKNGCKKLLIFSPAFVADCLETIEEIGGEYKELFKEHGGEELKLVPSLNDHPLWVETVVDLVKHNL